MALSSCESEVYSTVSSMGDSIYIRRCLEFALEVQLLQVQFTDSASARQLLGRQGCGKIRHFSGKVLWLQEKLRNGDALLVQIPTAWNTGDIGTKALPKKRLKALMCEVGMVYTETGETVGEADREELQNNTAMPKDVSKLAKTIMRMTVLLGLEPTGATAQFQEEQSCVVCG